MRKLLGAFILLSMFVTTMPRMAWSGADLGSACFIQSTPFYYRLVQAGVFDPIPETLSMKQPSQPLDLLFRMASSFHYSSDKQQMDLWQTAEETAKSYSGDCEDKAIWLYMQMRRNGYQDVALVIGRYGPNSSRFHVWVTYTDKSGTTLLLDPTIQRKPWNIKVFSKRLYHPAHVLSGSVCVSI